MTHDQKKQLRGKVIMAWAAYGFFVLILVVSAGVVFVSFRMIKSNRMFMVMNGFLALAGGGAGVFSYVFLGDPFTDLKYYVIPFFVWGGMGAGWLAILGFLLQS